MLKENILQLAASLFDETVANRRHLHAWPELSFQEYKTSEFVAKKLTDLKIPFEKKANTGIVALLKYYAKAGICESGVRQQVILSGWHLSNTCHASCSIS